ncbi:MAG: PP0621 family protein [Betaproteobacteria bacterium]
MGRLLVIVVLVVLAVWLLRRALRPPKPKADMPQKQAIEGELVACAHCGLNLPRGEALSAGNSLYCSEEHARKGPRA